MTCQDFINNLSELSESYDYSNEELKRLYNAIRLEPIRWPQVETGVLLGLYTGPGVGLPGATETLGLDLSLGMGLPGISGASNAGGGSIYATPAQCAPLPSLPPSQLAQLPPGLLGLHHAQAYAHAAAAAAAAAVTGPQAYSGHPCVPSSFYSGQPHFQTHLMQQQPNGQPIPGVTNAFYGHPQRMQLQQQPFGQQWYGVPPHLQQLTLATASTGVSSPPSTGPMQPVGVWSLPGQQATSNTGSADSSASHTGQVFSSELNNLDAQTRKLFVSSGFSPFLDIPAEANAKEYMRGFLSRKWVKASYEKKASLGKRGWKLLYARLRDLVLYLYKDAATASAAARAEELHALHTAHLQQYAAQQLALQRQQQIHQLQMKQQDREQNELKQEVSDEGNEAHQGEFSCPSTDSLLSSEPVVQPDGQELSGSSTDFDKPVIEASAIIESKLQQPQPSASPTDPISQEISISLLDGIAKDGKAESDSSGRPITPPSSPSPLPSPLSSPSTSPRHFAAAFSTCLPTALTGHISSSSTSSVNPSGGTSTYESPALSGGSIGSFGRSKTKRDKEARMDKKEPEEEKKKKQKTRQTKLKEKEKEEDQSRLFLEDNSASVPYSSSSATCYLPSSVLGLPGVSTDSTDSKPISPLPSPPAPVPQPLASTIAQTPPPPPQPPPPEAVIRIAHALASRANDYTKKANVFRLTTKDGAEYLFQVNDPKELDLWVDKLNFVAALLSAAPLPSAVGSERGFYRPHLPATYTKLNMCEQLEDHQRRLVDLDHQLVEMTAKRSQLSQIGLGQSTSGSMASLTSTTAATSGLPTSGSSCPSASVVPLISAPGMPGPDANELQTGTNANTGTHSDESDAIAAPILDSAQTSLPSTQPNIAVTARPPIPPGLINAGQAAAPLPTHTPTSNSLVSLAAAAFSTGSLGRRRKDSSGTPASSSLSSASLTSLLQLGSVEGSAATGSLSSTAAAVRQRQSLLVELDERIHFVEGQIVRYRTYARLLEAEIMRIHQVHQQMQFQFHIQQQQLFSSASANGLFPVAIAAPIGVGANMGGVYTSGSSSLGPIVIGPASGPPPSIASLSKPIGLSSASNNVSGLSRDQDHQMRRQTIADDGTQDSGDANSVGLNQTSPSDGTMTDFVSSSCDSIVTITSQSSEVRNSISSGLDSAVAPTGLELSEVTDAATSFAGDTVVGKGERRNLDSLITQNFENSNAAVAAALPFPTPGLTLLPQGSSPTPGIAYLPPASPMPGISSLLGPGALVGVGGRLYHHGNRAAHLKAMHQQQQRQQQLMLIMAQQQAFANFNTPPGLSMGPPGLPPSSLEAFTSVRPTRPNSSIPNPLTTSSTSSLASLSSPNSASTSANVSTSSSANVAYSFPSPPISTVPGPPALSVPTPSTLSTSMTLVQNPLFHHASISLHGSTVDDLPATSFYEII